jgi:hypothetical protein
MRLNLLAAFGAVGIAVAAYNGLSGPDNWPECIIDRIPGAQNDYAAAAVIQSCTRDFGDPQLARIHHSRTARYGSGDLCVMEKGKDTASELGARVLTASCHQLYDPPALDTSQFQNH